METHDMLSTEYSVSNNQDDKRKAMSNCSKGERYIVKT